jgi:diaminohydroxyphosphoribosylaminopyrimidine deaminase/5-amino-6-(5-phosphoribosylamino)uracil reductase
MTEVAQQRLEVTLKLATSLDARIATVSGASQWITGSLARQEVHRMRAAHDCVLTGIGTVLADDPLLNVRYGLSVGAKPLRALMDTQARLPSTAKLANSAYEGDVVWFTGQRVMTPAWMASRAMTHHALEEVQAAPGLGGLDLAAALAALQANYCVKSVMVEAGPKLATSFLVAGLVTKLEWFRAPILLGGDGRSVFDSLGVVDLAQAWMLQKKDTQSFGPDVLETYVIKSR